MTHQGLGEFEQMVLLAIAHLRGEAYGIPIVEEIERRTGRSVARAAVYITLRRLEDKGFVSSWMGEPTAERGGKARRHVKLEAEGAKALREARRAAERMWQGLDPASLRTR
jgi:DNA-binding PadR family transcriptional regulator